MPRIAALIVALVLLAAVRLGPAAAETSSRPATAAATLTSADHSPLNRLLVPGDKLPDGCRLAALDNEAPKWLPANPVVSSDRAFIAAFAEHVFGKDIDSAKITAAIFAVYNCPTRQDEVGTFGFQFTTAAQAKAAHDALIKKTPGTTDTSEWLVYLHPPGSVVVLLWRDTGKDNAGYRTIEKHLLATFSDWPASTSAPATASAPAR